MKLLIDIPDGLKDSFNHEEQWTSLLCADMRDVLNNGKPYEESPLYIEDVFRLVEGHSIYSGDSILSAFTCLSEGKDVKDITPLDISHAEIADLRREGHNE